MTDNCVSVNEKQTGGEQSCNRWLCNGRRSIAHSRGVILDMYVCVCVLSTKAHNQALFCVEAQGHMKQS